MLSLARAHELWDYNRYNGKFYSKRYLGRVVGTVTKAGYVVLEADGKQYLAHRIAWLFIAGEFPSESIDHVNGDKTDNRPCNLRLATISENNHNSKAHADNLLGIKGVCPTGKGTYRAYVSYKRRLYQTYHKTLEAAVKWVRNKRAELHGEFCHH